MLFFHTFHANKLFSLFFMFDYILYISFHFSLLCQLDKYKVITKNQQSKPINGKYRRIVNKLYNKVHLQMRPYVILLISLLVVIGYAGISIDTGRCKTDKYDNWDVFSCPCSGGSGQYDYQIEKLPTGWLAKNEKIYIPKNKIERKKYYPFKMSIFDRKDSRDSYRKSIIFNYEDDNKIGQVIDADYDFDFDNSKNFDDFIRNRARYTSSVIGSIRDSVRDSVDARVVSFDDRDRVVTRDDRDRVVVRDDRDDRVITRDDRVVDRVDAVNNRYDDRDRYSTFPSDDQIEDTLEKANVRRIKEIIKQVIDSSANCKVKSEFLEKLQGRVQVRISIFRSDAEKNRQAIVDLKTQIKNLKDDLDKYSSKGADYEKYNERIRGYRSQIDKHTKDRDTYDGDSRRSRDNIGRIKSEIEGHRSGSSESRRQIQIEERRMSDVDAQIADLEAKLRDLKRDRDDCRDRRDKHKSIVSDYDRKIEECNRRIKSEEDTIDGCDKKSKSCLSAINDFNKKIEDCNKQIDASGLTYKQRIADIKAKIAKNEGQIDRNTREIDRLTALYSDIESSQNEFESLMSRHYSTCYQYAPVNNDNYQYQAPSAAFLNYMKDVFGQVPNENIRARFSGTVNIKKNTIFSPAWTKVYGIPFTAGYGSNKDLSQDNFSCTESSDKLKVFSGKIEDINKNVLTVLSKSGDRYTVHLGGCTRIESISDKEIPTKGSEIYFKGTERKDKHYNGYHVTCY